MGPILTQLSTYNGSKQMAKLETYSTYANPSLFQVLDILAYICCSGTTIHIVPTKGLTKLRQPFRLNETQV